MAFGRYAKASGIKIKEVELHSLIEKNNASVEPLDELRDNILRKANFEIRTPGK